MAEPGRQPRPPLVVRALRSGRLRAEKAFCRSPFGTALGRSSFGTITSVVTSEPMAAITFDGGPDVRWTPQVLDVLDAYRAKATFFVIGKYVDLHPELMQRAHASGHALGNHSYFHPRFPLVSSAERRRELRACATALAPYPQRRQLFRPPYLVQDLATRYDSWRLGYDVIACSLHANDWEDRASDEMYRTLSDGAKPGDIIMLHDAVCDQRYRSREAMIEALEGFLRRRTDLRFVTVPELLRLGRSRREIWYQRPSLARAMSYERVF